MTPHLLRGGNDKNTYIYISFNYRAHLKAAMQRWRCVELAVASDGPEELLPRTPFLVMGSPVSEAVSYIHGVDCDEITGLWCCLLYRALIVFDEQTWPDTWRLVVKRRTEFTSIERFVSVNIWLTWTQVSRKNKKIIISCFFLKYSKQKKRNNKWIIMRFHFTGILLYSWSSKVCLKTNDAITKKLRDFKWHQVYPGTKSLIGPLLLLWFHAYTYFGTIFIPSLEVSVVRSSLIIDCNAYPLSNYTQINEFLKFHKVESDKNRKLDEKQKPMKQYTTRPNPHPP